MDPWEIEGDAEAILRSAGLDPGEDVRITRLVRGLGVELICSAAAPVRGDASLVRIGQVWRVYLRPRLPTERARFAVGHELAEWWLRRQGYREVDAEDVADRLGAALVAPRLRVVRLVRTDPTISELAAELEATESLAALRVGEATGEPIALVARRVRVRGEEWTWPPEPALRRALRGEAPKGLVKIPLSEPGRVLLKAEAG